MIKLTAEERQKLLASGAIVFRLPSQAEERSRRPDKIPNGAEPSDADLVKIRMNSRTEDYHKTGYMVGERVMIAKPWMKPMKATVIGFSYKWSTAIRVQIDGLTHPQTISTAYIHSYRKPPMPKEEHCPVCGKLL